MENLTDWHRQIAADIASAHPLRAANDVQPKQPFLITIGKRGEPRLSFGAMAVSSASAVEEHLCIAELGERVEAVAVRGAE